MSRNRIPCEIVVHPWIRDHFIGSRICLPAVESMIFLAAESTAAYPEIDIRIMEDVSFGKFFEIPADAAKMGAFIEYAACTDHRLQVKLLSRVQLKSMARLQEHCRIFFAAGNTHLPLQDIDPEPPKDAIAEISAAQVYGELVPFGTCYHTLQGTLLLTENEAWGVLKAPDIPFVSPVQEAIGSPFPLDGALHAACVLGQRLADAVFFPVGFGKRIVSRATLPGTTCLTRVTMTAMRNHEMDFDVHIFSDDGRHYETVRGLRMRDTRAHKV